MYMQPVCLICCARGDLIDEAIEPWGVAGLWLPIVLLCRFLCLYVLDLQWRWILGIWLTDRLMNSNVEM